MSSAIYQALVVFAEGAGAAENKLQRLVDKKKEQVELQKQQNALLDTLEDARGDGNFTSGDMQKVIDDAAAVGIDLSAEENFKVISEIHRDWGGNAGVDVAKEKWDDPRNLELDKVAERIERAIETTTDDTGLTDVQLNLAMTKYTDNLARMNNGVTTIDEILQATRQA